jgi:hypothetical protein
MARGGDQIIVRVEDIRRPRVDVVHMVQRIEDLGSKPDVKAIRG